jgi:hypothetical protein
MKKKRETVQGGGKLGGYIAVGAGLCADANFLVGLRLVGPAMKPSPRLWVAERCFPKCPFGHSNVAKKIDLFAPKPGPDLGM